MTTLATMLKNTLDDDHRPDPGWPNSCVCESQPIGVSYTDHVAEVTTRTIARWLLSETATQTIDTAIAAGSPIGATSRVATALAMAASKTKELVG